MIDMLFMSTDFNLIAKIHVAVVGMQVYYKFYHSKIHLPKLYTQKRGNSVIFNLNRETECTSLWQVCPKI